MKILNLINSKNSDIKFEISRFPDGQQQVKIIGIETKNTEEWGKDLVGIPIQIKARLNNFLDLELIICSVKSLKNLGVEDIYLYCPYFLGSRSDRKFEEGSNRYLKDIICPIINSLNFREVIVMDPHSYILENCLDNFNSIDNTILVKFTLNIIKNKNIILVSPDEGASKKIFKLANKIEFKGDIITCSKDRDINGKLTKCVVPLNNLTNKDLVIIDDICDGGATFINIAKTIKEHYTSSQGKLYLIVTHGIFSKGLKELSEHFDGIFCTNSYRDINSMNDFGMYNERYLHKIKQLNVF